MPGPMVDRLIDMDVSSWAEYQDEVGISALLPGRWRTTAFLSNGVPETMSRLRAERALDDGQRGGGVVRSRPRQAECADLELCLSRLGVHAGEALFVDNRAENVAAAERLGMRTLHFTGDDATARLLDAVRSRVA